MLPDLRIDPPRLEPDRVLLEQLSQLSKASAPVGEPGHMARSLLSAATVVVVAGVSWLTGTLPGVASPFDRPPAHQPTQQHAPRTPSGEQPSPEADVPSEPLFVPPGRAKPRDKGNRNGQTQPQDNNGNHNGQTQPQSNNGNHNGQTRPQANNGNHNGQTQPPPNNGNQGGQGNGQGGGQANGHRP